MYAELSKPFQNFRNILGEFFESLIECGDITHNCDVYGLFLLQFYKYFDDNELMLSNFISMYSYVKFTIPEAPSAAA